MLDEIIRMSVGNVALLSAARTELPELPIGEDRCPQPLGVPGVDDRGDKPQR